MTEQDLNNQEQNTLAVLALHFADVERVARYGVVNVSRDNRIAQACAVCVHDMLLLRKFRRGRVPPTPVEINVDGVPTLCIAADQTT